MCIAEMKGGARRTAGSPQKLRYKISVVVIVVIVIVIIVIVVIVAVGAYLRFAPVIYKPAVFAHRSVNSVFASAQTYINFVVSRSNIKTSSCLPLSFMVRRSSSSLSSSSCSYTKCVLAISVRPYVPAS